MTHTPSPTPPAATPPPGPGPIVTVPGFAVTWLHVLTVCGTIAVVFGGGFFGLISIIYGNIDNSIQAVDKKVDDLQTKMISAAKDAGSFQALLNESPDLKREIQETHDSVILHTVKLDNIDRSISTIVSSLGDLSNITKNVQVSVKELNDKFVTIEQYQKRP
jgi:archaellum component FlaC